MKRFAIAGLLCVLGLSLARVDNFADSGESEGKGRGQLMRQKAMKWLDKRKEITPEQREEISELREDWENLPPEEQEARQSAWQSLTQEERQMLKNNWQNLTPEQQERRRKNFSEYDSGTEKGFS
jgi:hypothetical protein